MKQIIINYPLGNLSIDELIIAKMFNEFTDDIKSKSTSVISDDDRRKIIMSFSEIFDSLNIHQNGVDREIDSIEQLSRLANSTSIKKQLSDLFKLYPMDVTFIVDDDSLMKEQIVKSIEYRNAKEKFGHVLKFQNYD